MVIKCLMAGCTKEIQPQEVRMFVGDELYIKYERFWQTQYVFSNSKNRVIINCPFPDCPQMFYVDEDSPYIECENGHKSCAKCKSLGWHKKGKCDQVILVNISIIQIFSIR
jgi:hypothetical protein